MNRILLAASAILVLTFSLVSAQGPEGGRQQSKLGPFMESLQATVEKVTDSLKADEPEFAALLAEVCELEKSAIDAKSESPRMFARMEADDKKLPGLKLDFRIAMQDLVRGLLDLELALAKEDKKAVKKALRELSKIEDAGHGDFRPRRGGR